MRKAIVLLPVAVLVVAAATVSLPRHWYAITWQTLTSPIAAPPAAAQNPFILPDDWSEALIASAESQIGETVSYDPAYVRITFPGGDVPRSRGICTDVVIRALRDSHGIDLQALVNRDMKRAFGSYPSKWGLSRPDPNIDHRRVPNLQRYFEGLGAVLRVSNVASDYHPGDIVTWKLPCNLDHIGIVTHRRSRDGARPLVVHNIGAGTRLQDMLFDYTITGHYRLDAEMFGSR